MSPTNQYPPAHSSQLAVESSSAFQYGSAAPHTTDPLGLDEEMPPAYTPSADTYHGETTVEVGPRRPFQQQPRPSHSTHRPSNSHSSSHSHSSHTTSSSSNSQPLSPSQQRPQQLTWRVPSSLSAPSGQSYQSRRGGGLVGALVSTMLDAMDSVSGTRDEQMRTIQQSQTGTYAAPHPMSSSGMTQSTYTPPYQGGQGPVLRTPSVHQTPPRNVPDDGSPTRTPTPGHPLLHNGHILVYPHEDYTCVKCNNTGYKNYDPSHPCRKCWEKYGKPYTGALMYTSWNTNSSSHKSKYQRALPRFTPPQASSQSSSSSHTSRSSHAPPQAHAIYVYNPIIGMGQTPPVPHAVPVRPGDARLGGQICRKCGGTGTLPLLIIDVRPCSVCGGIGRNLW
ncbi:uncharacterized protein HD556DRAFT_1507004 [Suillus plorans]|uniref:Uncharacterized protein n=1 Tax=Suillus plorans TaxID=116603 RepID=A0A9P7ACJ9_9AGAM|nr:uncharacterized protein HD556DRAFT_1507004 [Suillus plorans]KAG1786566.1 hypothetical protein HD556DRAFT_1507004 [Suillus plorans]